MCNRDEDEPEAAGGPRHVGLEAAAEVGAVTAFGVATLHARHREAVVAVRLAAKGVERDAGASGEVLQVLGDRLLIEQDGHHRPSGAVRHR
jgi:hypothetical protein